MIRISLGNPGSGKTVSEVREIFLNKAHRKTFSNIITKKISTNNLIKSSMIVNKNVVDTRKKRDGSVENVYELKLNVDYWKDIKEPINVVLDEAHSIINARRSMSKVNIIVSDWLALIRRVLGTSDSGYGEMVFITQLHNRIDIIAREMATQIRYHKCHYKKKCNKCSYTWQEDSDQPEPRWSCPYCNSPSIKKYNHIIEVWHFDSMDAYIAWKDYNSRSYYRHYLINDIEKYFPLYDTLQWENMFSDLY